MQIRHLAAAAAFAAACLHTNAAPPMTLRYSVADLSDGSYRYSFVLTLDDPEKTWTPGDGFGWLVFGDRQDAASTLADWAPDGGSLSGGPWIFFTSTAGYNNGPTLGDGRAVWIPTYQGESAVWSGVSRAQFAPGDLRWSCLLVSYINPVGKPLGPIAAFEPAVWQCRADFDHDGFVTGEDFDAYLVAFNLGDVRADFNGDGFVTGNDFDEFVSAFESGC